MSKYSVKDEKSLMTSIWDPQIADNPEAFVMFSFPWGKEGTPLHKFQGPRTWQRDELQAITQHIKDNKERIALGVSPKVYQSSTASGRGVGKSALVAWINLWFMSTALGGSAINTANTETQLKSRTWAELGKWHTLSINSHWFDRQALSLKPASWFDKALREQLKIDTGYYYSQAQLWSEEDPDAFAGVHNHNGVLLLMDEASGIPEVIWQVSEGFFTDPVLHRYWFSFSNPRRNTGAFFECFHKYRKYWRRRNLDSRTVEGTDKQILNTIIEKYGEDSDQARIEVKGLFPKQGERQFISRELIEEAKTRELVEDKWAPIIMGIDVARFGGDKSVFRFRQGRNGRVVPPVEFSGLDNMELANEAAHWISKIDPDAVCVDAGNGTGVIDRLREMGYKVHEVWFGSKSPEPEYSNFRTYLWSRIREFLRGGCIDDLPELSDDLAAPEYKFMGSSDKQRLETKEELKARGFSSPDHGDALACTFAVKIARRDMRSSRRGTSGKTRKVKGADYNVFGQ